MIFQLAVMRRPLTGGPRRKFFLFCDEAANFLVPRWDAMFLSQSRQFGAGCIHLVQNFPLVVTALGGDQGARENAIAWLSNHATIMAAANFDRETNELMSGLCPERKETMYGGSASSGGAGEPYSVWDDLSGQSQSHAHANWHQEYRPAFPPDHFAGLLRGGAANNFECECIVVQAGRVWSNGKRWLRARLKQVL
jgi:hypothetical protein